MRFARPGVGQLALRAPPAADFGQLGIRLDFDAKTFVVAEVPVEHIELVHRHQVDEPLDVVRVEEVPRLVQHEAAPGETRLIGDLDSRARSTRPRFAESWRRFAAAAIAASVCMP